MLELDFVFKLNSELLVEINIFLQRVETVRVASIWAISHIINVIIVLNFLPSLEQLHSVIIFHELKVFRIESIGLTISPALIYSWRM